jgi:hypothetical protein
MDQAWKSRAGARLTPLSHATHVRTIQINRQISRLSWPGIVLAFRKYTHPCTHPLLHGINHKHVIILENPRRALLRTLHAAILPKPIVPASRERPPFLRRLALLALPQVRIPRALCGEEYLLGAHGLGLVEPFPPRRLPVLVQHLVIFSGLIVQYEPGVGDVRRCQECRGERSRRGHESPPTALVALLMIGGATWSWSS